MMYRIVVLLFIVSYSMVSSAEYHYEKIESNNHIVHLVIIDPNEYESSLVVAHN